MPRRALLPACFFVAQRGVPLQYCRGRMCAGTPAAPPCSSVVGERAGTSAAAFHSGRVSASDQPDSADGALRRQHGNGSKAGSMAIEAALKWVPQAFCLGWWLSAGVASAADGATCATPVLLQPAAVELADVSPRFSWSQVSGATHYSVRIESRVPEGRVLLSEQFRTADTSAQASRPLAAGDANVVFAVVAHCGETSSAELTVRRRVDAALVCPADVWPLERASGNGSVLRWSPVPSASSYEMSVRSPSDGAVYRSSVHRTARATLGTLPAGDWMVAVTPLCGVVRGRAAYLILGVGQ